VEAQASGALYALAAEHISCSVLESQSAAHNLMTSACSFSIMARRPSSEGQRGHRKNDTRHGQRPLRHRL